MRKLFKILGKIAGILAGLYALLFISTSTASCCTTWLSRSSAGITIKCNARTSPSAPIRSTEQNGPSGSFPEGQLFNTPKEGEAA